MDSGSTSRPGAIAAASAILVAIVLFHGPGWFTPYGDPSIGLQLHIATAWLHGHLPYTTTWDFRPPGYDALWTLALAAVGPYFARDALTITSLAGTAAAVGYAAYRLDPKNAPNTGYAAAALFALVSTSDDAVVGTAELQVSLFIAAAIAVALMRRPTIAGAAISGMLAGAATQCQLIALPLVVVPLAVILIRGSKRIYALATFAGGFLFPALCETILYLVAGKLPAFYDANITALARRASERASTLHEFDRNRHWFLRQLIELAPPIELGIFAVPSMTRLCAVVCGGWIAAGLVAIYAGGEYFERHFIMLAAPAALVGGLGFISLMRSLRARPIAQWVIAVSLFLLGLLLHDYFEFTAGIKYFDHRIVDGDANWNADEFMIARAELTKLNVRGSSLFVIEQSPYLYDVLGVPSPTRFDFSDTLLDPRLSQAAGIDGFEELQRIFSQRPRFVVLSSLTDYRDDPARVRYVLAELQRHYHQVFADRDVQIYEQVRYGYNERTQR